MARLKQLYTDKIQKQLMEKFAYANIMQVPRIEKVIINMGCGEAALDNKKLVGAVDNLQQIAGQKVVITRAKNSIAGFKLREGMPVGVKVTLRKERMYEFLDRFINIAMPRIKDFRGISPKSFDGRGNFAMGVKEQMIFPEINYDQVDAVRGMDIIIVTSAKTNEEAKELLSGFNMPFTS